MSVITLKCPASNAKLRFNKCHKDGNPKKQFMMALFVYVGGQAKPESPAESSPWQSFLFLVSSPKAPSGTAPSVLSGEMLHEHLCSTFDLAENSEPVVPELPGFTWNVTAMLTGAHQMSITGSPSLGMQNPLCSEVSTKASAKKSRKQDGDSASNKVGGGVFMEEEIRGLLFQLPKPFHSSKAGKKLLSADHFPPGSWYGKEGISCMRKHAGQV